MQKQTGFDQKQTDWVQKQTDQGLNLADKRPHLPGKRGDLADQGADREADTSKRRVKILQKRRGAMPKTGFQPSQPVRSRLAGRVGECPRLSRFWKGFPK